MKPKDYDSNYIPQKTFFLVGQKVVVLNKKGQILVLQRSNKAGGGEKWSLPGGGLEKGEKPFESIKREIKEETNLFISDLKSFSFKSYTNKEDEPVLIIGYQCRASATRVELNWEHDNYKWVTREDALGLDLTEDARFFVDNYSIKN